MSLASKLSITDVDVKDKKVLIRVSSGTPPCEASEEGQQRKRSQNSNTTYDEDEDELD